MIKKTTTSLYEMTLNRKELIATLNEAIGCQVGDLSAIDSLIPENAAVAVKVPSGGDYSGMMLEDPDIIITWTMDS